MTLTIELPDSLIEQLNERQISEEELKAVVVAAVEIWLAQEHSTNDVRFAQSAVRCVRQLIAENRELFEALGKNY